MSDAPDEDRLFRRGCVLLIAVTALVYASVVTCGFVWDDRGQIVENAAIADLRRIPSFFGTDVWGSTGAEGIRRPPYYRPLFLTSLAIDRALWGLDPAGYHLHSLAWHLAATGALALFLRRVFGRSGVEGTTVDTGPDDLAGRVARPGGSRSTRAAVVAPLVGATVFALHPAQSEAVAWVSARVDPMAATFGSLALFGLWPARPSRAGLIGGGLCLLAAALCKEPAVTIPALLVLLELAFRGRLTSPPRYVAIAAALATWAGMRAWAGIDAAAALPPDRLPRLISEIPEILGVYGRALFLPWPLTTGRHLLYLNEPLAATLTGWILPVLGAGFVLRRGRWTAATGLVFAALSFAPSLYAMAGSLQIGERYLYLPMIGLATAVAASCPRLPLRQLTALALVPVVWLVIIVLRLPDWKDGVALTYSEVRAAPSPYSWGGYGLELAGAGRRAEALPWLARGLEGTPPERGVCVEAVRGALLTGQIELALQNAQRTRARGCAPTPELLALHALVYAHLGRWEETRAAIAVARKGDDTSYWLPAGAALALVDGDRPEFERLRALAAGNTESFDRALERILTSAGRNDLLRRNPNTRPGP